MKELIQVRVQYASRQQCCKTHKRPFLAFAESGTATYWLSRPSSIQYIDSAAPASSSYSVLMFVNRQFISWQEF